MSRFDKEVDHYEVIVTNENGVTYAEKEFFNEDEAVAYAKEAHFCGFTVSVMEVDNIIWW